MKRILILCSAIAVCTVLLAQTTGNTPDIEDRITVGLKTGFSFPDMRFSDTDLKIYKHEAYCRGSFSFFSEFDIWKGLSVRPELTFIGRGTRMNYKDVNYNLKSTYFDIRGSIMYTFLKDFWIQPYVVVAPNLDFTMNGKIRFDSELTGLRIIDLNKSNIAPVDFSLFFGAGAKFWFNIADIKFLAGTEIGYNLGLVNTFSRSERNHTAIDAISGGQSKTVGKRKNGGVEWSFIVGFPLSNINSIKDKSAAKKAAKKEQEVKEENKISLDKLREDALRKQALWQQELDEKKKQLPLASAFSDNILVSVAPTIEMQSSEDGTPEINLVVGFAYQTTKDIKTSYSTKNDDYPPGAYNMATSKACMFTCDYIKNKIDQELAQYLTDGRKVTIKITGETDGSPINAKLPYKGEYGDFENKIVYLNGALSSISVTKKSGITSNPQLAFLRTKSVEDFLRNYIDPLKKTENSYQIYTVENAEKGNEFRKVSIELTIHGAYNQEYNLPDPVYRKGDAVANGNEATVEEQKSDVDVNIPEATSINKNYYALIISSENYEKYSDGYISNVPFAINDGTSFKEYCQKTLGIPENQIIFVKDATFAKLKDGVNKLTRTLEANNGDAKAFVYYSGHGYPNPNDNAAYLVPVDANPNDVSQLYSLSKMYDELGSVPAKSVTVFLDACFSGTKRNGASLVEGARGVKITPKKELLKGNTVVFSAADGTQTAHPYKEQKHGLFTYFLLKTIQESGGKLTYGELFETVKKQVAIQGNLMNGLAVEQTPTINTSSALESSWQSMQLGK